MKRGNAGWLRALLEEVQQGRGVPTRAEGQTPSARAGRKWLRELTRTRGLSFGVPAARAAPGEAEAAGATEGVGPGSPQDLLFRDVVRHFAELAHDAAEATGAPPPGPRELCVLLALQAGAYPVAEDVAGLPGGLRPDVPRRLWARVEEALEAWSASVAGDPALGLVLHTGVLHLDALTFMRNAVAHFAGGKLDLGGARRRADLTAAQKALLVEVLAGLACAERRPGQVARRAILRQVEGLRLPPEVEDRLRIRVRRVFERPARVPEMVRAVRARQSGRFLLAQALLSARVEGRTTAAEQRFLQELAEALGLSGEVPALEGTVVDFYARNRHLVDVFTGSAAATAIGEELLGTVQTSVEKNFERVMTELRETGELSVLLARAARGQSLNREERGRMRAQLIDLAKVVPALAIFAAPGGVLMLIALARVLPFSLLPSAFQEEQEGTQREPPKS